MFIKAVLAINLLVMSNVTFADSYELLKKSDSGGLYYLRGSFDNTGKKGQSYPLLTILINDKNGYDTPKGDAHSVLLFLILNCPNKLQVVSSGLYYSGTFAEGVKVYQDNETYSAKMFKSIEKKFCKNNVI